MRLFLLLFISFSSVISFGQNVGIGTNVPHTSAALEIQDTSRGILIPRMTMAQRNAIANPAEGLMVYQTGDSTGFWFFDGAIWKNTNRQLSNNSYGTHSNTINDYVIPNNQDYYWGFAMSSIVGFSYNGYSDWRIPTQEDMIKVINKYGFAIFGESGSYWTSTYLETPGSGGTGNYSAIVLSLNGTDWNNEPIGPTLRSTDLNKYNYCCPYGTHNPDKAKVIYVR